MKAYLIIVGGLVVFSILLGLFFARQDEKKFLRSQEEYEKRKLSIRELKDLPDVSGGAGENVPPSRSKQVL